MPKRLGTLNKEEKLNKESFIPPNLKVFRVNGCRKDKNRRS
jgi:hypothetical protein